MNALVSPVLVDAREKVCPLPILELAKALRPLASGAEVVLLATDPAVEPDVLAFCSSTGHRLVSFSADGRILRAHVRKQ